MPNCYPLPEWYPQDASVLVWPHRYSDWTDSLAIIEQTYLVIAKNISAHQLLLIIHFDHQHKELIQDQCIQFGCNMSAVSFLEIETNDTWVRDYAPLILLGHKEFECIDFEFNAWGEQFPHRLDNLFAEKIYNALQLQNCEYRRSPLVIEGGNLDFNSNATVLTNLSCIIKNNTKLNLNSKDLPAILQKALSIKKILGLEVPPLAGDDTGGHIDTMARFINDDTIVYASPKDANDPNFDCLNILHSQLQAIQVQKNLSYKLVAMPMPDENICDPDGNQLPATYLNFVFTNDALLVPVYNDKNDIHALDILRNLCRNRAIIAIDATALIQQYGSLHCATFQLPQYLLNESRISTA